jgi:hypothetical protein
MLELGVNRIVVAFYVAGANRSGQIFFNSLPTVITAQAGAPNYRLRPLLK